MEADGSVRIADVLKLNEYKGCSLDMIKEIVRVDAKGRYNLECKEGTWWISANQGHSKSVSDQLDPEKYLTPLTEALPLVLHGTYSEYMDSIRENGLKAQTRGQIHCAQGMPKTVKSGMRKDCDAVVEINMEKALKAGYKFYRSRNDVILIDGDLPKEFITVRLISQN
jgi:2'-phosphotransferase